MPLRMLPYPSDTYHQLSYHSWIVCVKWGCFLFNVRLNLQTGFADCLQFIEIDVSLFLCSPAIHLENIAVAFLTKILHQHVCCHDFLHWWPVNSLRIQLAFIWDYGMLLKNWHGFASVLLQWSFSHQCNGSILESGCKVLKRCWIAWNIGFLRTCWAWLWITGTFCGEKMESQVTTYLALLWLNQDHYWHLL